MDNKTNRYIIFAGETYYPVGGWLDIYGVAETLDNAMVIFNQALEDTDKDISWAQIVDVHTQTMIKFFDCNEEWVEDFMAKKEIVEL